VYELPLLKLLLDRATYSEYRQYLNEKDFSAEIKPILVAIDRWYKFEERDPTLEDIAAVTFARGVAEKQKEYLKTVFQTMAALNTDDSAQKLIERLKQEQVCKELSLKAYEASLGKASIEEVSNLAAKLTTSESLIKIDYVTDDIEAIIENHIKTPGLRWRLGCLNRSLGSLRPGDFGFVFARPETGKTTFLSSEATFMAEQLQDEAGPILWCNNEEAGEDVKFRNYLSALGATKDQLLKHPARAREAYKNKIKDKILLYDSAATSRHTVESLGEREKPSLLIFDQIDKIQGFKGDRKDLELGAVYQWARELSKTYCPVIGVCQADGTAEGVRYLNMVHVAEAKTAKQAEADWILGIGKTYEQGFEYSRFLNICKNKLTGDSDTDPAARHGQYMVLIKPEIGRYEDLD
jgi:hypothetical protein